MKREVDDGSDQANFFSLLSSSSLRERSDRLLGLSLSPPSPLEIGGVSSRERYDPLLPSPNVISHFFFILFFLNVKTVHFINSVGTGQQSKSSYFQCVSIRLRVSIVCKTTPQFDAHRTGI